MVEVKRMLRGIKTGKSVREGATRVSTEHVPVILFKE